MQQTRVSANCSCEHAQFSYDLSSLQCNCASAVLESPCVVSPPIPRPILSFRICSVPYFRPQFRSAPFREIVLAGETAVAGIPILLAVGATVAALGGLIIDIL